MLLWRVSLSDLNGLAMSFDAAVSCTRACVDVFRLEFSSPFRALLFGAFPDSKRFVRSRT